MHYLKGQFDILENSLIHLIPLSHLYKSAINNKICQPATSKAHKWTCSMWFIYSVQKKCEKQQLAS